MEIIVDNKEDNKFISKLIENLAKKVKIEVRSLDLGDIAFYYKGSLILLIERKTINDLAASLNDGRYHEQKARLKVCSCGVIYLIEGKYENLDKEYHGKFDKEKYKGCIINTMIRDRISIYHSDSMDETVEFIIDINKRIPKYVEIIGNKVTDEVEYAGLIKVKKRENITNKICYLNQLKQIPGVSVGMAEKIAEKYGTMNELIQEYHGQKDERARKIMLRDIKIADSRKLGPIVSERIYYYLFH